MKAEEITLRKVSFVRHYNHVKPTETDLHLSFRKINIPQVYRKMMEIFAKLY